MKNLLQISPYAWGKGRYFIRLRWFQDDSGPLKRYQRESQHSVRGLDYSGTQRLRSAIKGYHCIEHFGVLSGAAEMYIRDHKHWCEELPPAGVILRPARFTVPCFTPRKLVDVTVPGQYLRSRMRGDA